ncbi:DUF4387 family protein [Yoonia sp. R2331]|uniref:DUF4387 family protein n=1 Tax=Yoonia sp. R2331 TaxID=3237238 RepID=UPI0034E55885
MTTVGDVVVKVRSKNAGPFWLTVDIFCGNGAAFDRVVAGLSTDRVAAAFAVTPEMLKRFDIADLHVVKFSLPRPTIQGDVQDRDMHGAGWAPLVAEMALN